MKVKMYIELSPITNTQSEVLFFAGKYNLFGTTFQTSVVKKPLIAGKKSNNHSNHSGRR